VGSGDHAARRARRESSAPGPESIVRGRAARQEADVLADELLGVGADGAVAPTALASRDSESDALITARRAVVQRLREQDRAVTPALRWLESRLEVQGTTSDDIVRVEHQRQAAMNVTVRNVIMSMSLMSAFDWTEFFESVSLVDEVLHAGPNYAAMDFPTRDAYRHAVEELGRAQAGPSWTSLAQPWRARSPGPGPADDRQTDPGFYLIGNGAWPSRRRSVTERRLCADCFASISRQRRPDILEQSPSQWPRVHTGSPCGRGIRVGPVGLLVLALLAVSRPRTWRSLC